MMMQVVASNKNVNRMNTNAVAASMAPLLLRPLLVGDCEIEDDFDVGGDGSMQLLQAAAAANHAQAIVITLLEEDASKFGVHVVRYAASKARSGLCWGQTVRGECLNDIFESTRVSGGLPTEMQIGLLSPLYLRKLFECMGTTNIKLGQVQLIFLLVVQLQCTLLLIFGDLVLINCLLNAAGDPNQKDEEGNRPLEVAALRENKRLLRLFPLTTKSETVSDWTIVGVLAHIESNKEQEENSNSQNL
ncbi:hypothetical protein Bca52824_027267 [Brassica carinata]|uniref:Rho-GAP domain-containing protein n=1 Tax=Brassica carinata TaxID=52824 RepID=A0A8X7SI71_BRACI|nr:hypothetical protein Bca52824_027267 [Brassica carinata]